MKKPSALTTTFYKYTISSVLGQGGSGVVYLASTTDGEKVAIKCLDPKHTSSEKLKRFKNEYIFCSKTDHPNIIQVTDHGISEDGIPFFVMPVYESSIRQVLGKIEEKNKLEVFSKILDGVDAAHKLGVIHRDLKPENILIEKLGMQLVVADFGIARFEEDELYTAIETKDGSRLANFLYASPEQRVRGGVVDHKADIYALGLILNELFTNEVPQGTNFRKISAIAKDFSYLDGIVEKMLAQNPADRPSSIEEIKKELLARGNEFIALQKLSESRKQVVNIGAVDDVLITDPMRIVNVDWENGVLSIEFNHIINANWALSLRNMGGHESLLGKGPENFDLRSNKATIGARPEQAQVILDYFKRWLPRANQVYIERVKQEKIVEENRLRKEIEQEIARNDERAKVIGSLKF